MVPLSEKEVRTRPGPPSPPVRGKPLSASRFKPRLARRSRLRARASGALRAAARPGPTTPFRGAPGPHNPRPRPYAANLETEALPVAQNVINAVQKVCYRSA